MANNAESKKPDKAAESPPRTVVAPSPHLADPSFTTQRMMIDVLIALAPVMAMSVVVFGVSSLVQVGVALMTCLISEAIFQKMRGRPVTLFDGSAAVTGIILGLSLPWSAPLYVGVIASFVAIGMGKIVFGGLGFNIFNPAMVGRAFVMLSFAKVMGAGAFVNASSKVAVLTQATPLDTAKKGAEAMGGFPELWPLFLGSHNGSLGETSALAALVGGLYLVIRRTASWEIPVGVVLASAVLGGLCQMAGLTELSVLQQLSAGALIFGAFFIATDPVTSPLTPKGKFIFGLGVGFFIILIRVFSGYPEGVMFAILLMNSATPLINRWTIPRPFGGPVPEKA